MRYRDVLIVLAISALAVVVLIIDVIISLVIGRPYTILGEDNER